MGDDAASNPGTGDEPRGDSERVEQFFEQWAGRLGRFVAGAAARAREGAEDIFAEAQRIRRGEGE
jgi:hypothetical protein